MRALLLAAAALAVCSLTVAGAWDARLCSWKQPPSTAPPPCPPPALVAPCAGLQQRSSDLDFWPVPADQALRVGSEAELQAALAAPSRGWDGAVVQLSADIELTSTLLISGPLRLQGSCGRGEEGRARRCVLRRAPAAAAATASPLPLLHISGPSAVVEIANLELLDGVGAGSLAGCLTASNHSLVDLVGVRLAGCRGASGGALRADSHARLGLAGCDVVDNVAQVGACWGDGAPQRGVQEAVGCLLLPHAERNGRAEAT